MLVGINQYFGNQPNVRYALSFINDDGICTVQKNINVPTGLQSLKNTNIGSSICIEQSKLSCFRPE